MKRREFLRSVVSAGALLPPAARALGQGMASRGVLPAPRPKFSGRPWPVTLVDMAPRAGLTAPVIYGEEFRKQYIFEANGPGIAFYDYDGDGWLDIFVPSGMMLGNLSPGEPPPTNRLYHNNRDGTFTDITEKAGLGQSRPRFSTGCTFVDYDRDGRLDLFVSRYIDFDFEKGPAGGESQACKFQGVPVACGPLGLPKETCSLYHNNGDGTFTEVTEKAGIARAGKR